MKLHFYMPVDVYFENGCVAGHGDVFKKMGSKAMIITDPISAEVTGAKADVIKELDECGISYLYFDKVQSNPTIGCVREALAALDECGADFIIAIGGGSALDTGKAVSILSRQNGTDDEIFRKAYTDDTMPLICIPTTSGTGSEVTPYAMIIDEKKGTKNNLNSPYLFADVALLDPKYTMTVPYKVTVNTAVDAMTHAMESLFAVTTNHLVRTIAFKGLERMGPSLRDVLKGDLTPEARENLMFGSLLGGIVVSQTRTSALHGMSYPMTSIKHIPHGRAMSLIIPNYLEFWNTKEPELIEEIIDAMGYGSLDEFVDVLRGLMGEVAPEEKLTLEEKQSFIKTVMGQHNILNTRVDISAGDIRNIYDY